MVKRSPWLDVVPARDKATRSQLEQRDRWATGTVTEILEDGRVAVSLDGSDEPDVVAPSAAGLTAVGAQVRALRDSTGRVIEVSTPVTLPAGSEPVGVGVTGRELAYTRAIQEQIARDQAALAEAMAQAAVDLEAARGDVEAANADLDFLNAETLPTMREQLDAADAAAQETLSELDSKLSSAASSADLSAVREQIAAVQAAASQAQTTADQATSAASAANQAALQAAGIADSKGKVIYSETAPTGADRSSSNLWIQPSTEKTFTWDGDSWEEITSDSLKQAAQDALDAKAAAATAQSTAETATAKAQQAIADAAKAQQTADEATLDARLAHNAAVDAQSAAEDALAKYGPLDQRTLDAQAAAKAAQAKADSAYALAASKPDMGAVEAKITASANGKNSITVSTAAPTSSTPGVVAGDTWWQADTAGNVFAQFTWDGTAWKPRMVRSEMIANLDVHKLTVTGDAKIAEAVITKLWVDGLAAKTVTTSSLTVATGNILANGDLREGDLYWTAGRVQDGVFSSTTAGSHFQPPTFPLAAGAEYLFEMEIKADKPGSVVYLECRSAELSGDHALEGRYLVANYSVPTEWTTVRNTVKIKAGVSTGYIGQFYINHRNGTETSATVSIRRLSLRPKVGAVLIEDGAVLAEKIAANAITGDKILANSITGDKIVGNTITGDKIVGSSITGDKIAANSIAAEKIIGGDFSGKTFTGGTFNGAAFRGGSYATSSKPAEGGLMLDTYFGIRLWNPSGKKTFHLDLATGTLDLAERIYMGNDGVGGGLIILPSSSTTGGGMWWSTDKSADGPDAAIWRAPYSATGRQPLYMRGANGGGVTIQDQLMVSPGGITADGPSFLSGTYVDTLFITNIGPAQYSANLVIGGDGKISKATSSRRYKRNIVEWNPEVERVLALQPRQWQHRNPNDPDDIDERWYVGFIAEEVHDLGFTELVRYEGDGRGGWRPDALNYDRFAAAQQVVLKQHEERIAELEKRNKELEERLARLEATMEGMQL